MLRLLPLAAVLFTCLSARGQSADPTPREPWAFGAEDRGRPLPKHATPEERDLPLPEPVLGTPPTGAVHCAAEYEPMAGLLIAWESYTDVLTNLAVGVTTGDPAARVYVVVDTQTERNNVFNILSAAGAVMERVEFLVVVTDSVWIRDYGPRYIFEDGVRAIIDHTYNRPSRVNDDRFNDFLAQYWGEPQYDIPLVHGGGNFHLFTNREAFMTRLILNENPSKTEQEVKSLFREYQNLDLTITEPFPTRVDSTQHIDMWMMPVGEYKVIVGRYPYDDGYPPHRITEQVAAELTSRGYTVYRTPGWNSGPNGYDGTHYTYTNAVVLNNQIFVPQYGGAYQSQDAEAIAVFRQAMPGYTVRPIDCSSIIFAAGAVHCVVMHVPRAVSHKLGDTNCDQIVDFGDINPFVTALGGYDAYRQSQPDCIWLNADCNQDRRVDFGDISPFIALLGGARPEY